MNDNWPDALIGTYEWHGLDILIYADLAALILSFFVVGAWIYRAHANFDLIDGPAKEFTPGWAVGWFAVPIVSLWMPFKAMKELWQGSHAMAIDTQSTAPALLWVWWLSWIASNIAGFQDYFNAFDVIGYLATCVSAVCLIVIIRQINDAQPSMSISSMFE